MVAARPTIIVLEFTPSITRHSFCEHFILKGRVSLRDKAPLRVCVCVLGDGAGDAGRVLFIGQG